MTLDIDLRFAYLDNSLTRRRHRADDKRRYNRGCDWISVAYQNLKDISLHQFVSLHVQCYQRSLSCLHQVEIDNENLPLCNLYNGVDA